MKLELKHVLSYQPYQLMMQYIGILNGKELSKWQKENEGRDIFEEPETLCPETVYGNKQGLIKKIETYLDYWKIRVGNGHKNIYKSQIGKDAFLILKPLSEITKEILDEFNFIERPTENEDLQFLSYGFMQYCFENQYDIFGLIKAGLAIDMNTL